MSDDKSTIRSSEPIFTLSVAAKLSNTSIYSLRQYVDKGLVRPFRKDSNRHLYSEVDVLRIKCIRRYLNEYGLNIAGIKAIFALVPCWVIKPCSKEDQRECDAFTSLSKPCWELSNKGAKCRNEDCQNCEVYQLPEKCDDVKSMLKKVIENIK